MENDFSRLQEWEDFAAKVTQHLVEYTIPQYGDFPNDQMTTAAIADIKHNMTRYLNRMDNNVRGQEDQLRDLLKLAHYSCLAYTKFIEKFQMENNNNVRED